MEKLTDTIAANITALRKNAGLTQVQFAEKLNYSNKTVSKWERGEAAPDIETLKEIADLFHVNVDYFLHTHEEVNQEMLMELEKQKKNKRNNQIVFSSLGVCFVLILATIIFIYLIIFSEEGADPSPWAYSWLSFVWAIPASCLILGYMSKKWMPRNLKCVIYSVFTWSVMTAIILQCGFSYGQSWQNFDFTFTLIYVLGIPIQVAIILYGRLK